MATWVDRSFGLAQQAGYLDKLAAVYPVPPPTPRVLTETQLQTVEQAFQLDDPSLLEALLRLKKFPFNDPYVGLLRKSPDEILRNPETVRRICLRLRDMGLDGVIDSLQQPKQSNRQMGPLFGKWLRRRYLFAPDIAGFRSSREPVVFLGTSGESLRLFANEKGCGLTKQPDFVAKVSNRYVVGEAKFIGTEGGNQNRAFEDALAVASSSCREAITVAVLDGIVWIPDSGQMSRRLANFAGNALAALLLDDFLGSC